VIADFAANEIGHPARRVRDELALLIDEHVHVAVYSPGFRSGAHPSRHATDDD
jgi:hypothetical protein